jgi:8-oxo-dGTP diphosphatase
VQGGDGHYQIPGGGWEHGESAQNCLDRELREELGVGLDTNEWDGRPLCVFQAWHPRLQRHNLRVCYLARLASTDFTFGDGIRQARWVSEVQLPEANLPPDDVPLLGYTHLIWPPGEQPS